VTRLLPVFSGEAVRKAVPPLRAFDAVRDAFVAHARGEWTMQPKVYVANYPAGDFRAMPALGAGHALLKWVTSFPGNPARGLPTVSGLVLLSNAETGEQGLADAWAMCERAGGELGLDPTAVAVAETGVIGVPLPIDAVLGGIAEAAGALSASGAGAFSEAIMTTDRWPKRCTVRAGGVTVSAQAKGGGMIQPKMATMLCFVQTDAVVDDPGSALRAASDASFERITVDGQMSTNDTVLLQATGEAGAPLPGGLLDAVLLQLALEIVADGEGSSRVGRIGVEGAVSPAEAERVARAIANSPLVKTALFGRDPNWGRIAQAAGMALAGEDLEEIGSGSIDAAELGEEVAEAEIGLRLERGDAAAHVYFSDLGYEYVRVNADYTS